MKQRKKRTALGPRVASFAMIAMLLAAGCAQPYGGAEPVVEPVPAPSGQPLSVLMEGPSTKMNVNDDTGYCTWATTAPKDRIAIWVSGSGANAYREAEVTVEDTNADARVGGVTLSVADAQTREHYAVFPVASAVAAHHTADDFCVEYPTSYDLSAVAASSLQTYAQPPMVAVNDASDPSLKFYHVGGLLRIELSSSEIVGATSVAVTFLGLTDVTGTYKVVDGSGTGSSRTESAPVSGTGNVVTFTIPAVGSTGQTWVNVPLPAGDYSKLKGVQVSVSGGGVNKTQVKAAPWPNIARRQGKKLSFNFAGAGALSYVDIAAEESVTLWKGVTTESFGVSAFDSEGTQLTGASFTWTSSDPSVATVSGGAVTAGAPGSATIKASCTVGGVTKEDSFTVYVNEASITLSPSELTGRVGKSRKVKAEVTYTRNGNWSVPELSWRSTNTSIATVDMASTLPGEANTVRFVAVTSGSTPAVAIVAEILSGSTVVASAQSTISVVSAAYVPGKFTVSAGKSVWFASGNLLVENTKNSSGNQRVWKFEANQWESHHQPAGSNYEYSVEGETRYISNFGWATAGVKNPNGSYGYDQYHTRYLPHQNQTSVVNNANNYYGYGPSTDGTGSGWAQKGAPTVTSGGAVYFPFVVDINNTWNSALAGGLSTSNQVRKFCDWGIHFNDAGEGSDSRTDGIWYTLSPYQWTYLFETRDKAKLLRGLGMIYDSDSKEFVSGLIILPDNWETPEDCTFLPIISD